MKQTGLLIVTILGTLLMAGAVVLLLSKPATPSQNRVEPSVLLTDTRLMKGPEQAQVTIVEFSDFQCPACLAAQPIVQKVLSKYPDQVRLVYRHFPLTQIHPNAYSAALAADAVYQINASDSARFWAYHDVLYTRQSEWSALTGTDVVRDKYTQYAIELGIDKTQFSEKMKSEEVVAGVEADIKTGNLVGVTFTPSFFVNGTLHTAGELEKAVDELIKSQ